MNIGKGILKAVFFNLQTRKNIYNPLCVTFTIVGKVFFTARLSGSIGYVQTIFLLTRDIMI